MVDQPLNPSFVILAGVLKRQTAQGFRRFSLRGILKVRCEWALVCLTHNVLKLFRNAPEIMLGA